MKKLVKVTAFALSMIIVGIISVTAVIVIAEKSNDGIKLDADGDYYRNLTHIFMKIKYCRFNSLGIQIVIVEPNLISGNKVIIQDKNLDNVVDSVVIESQQKINGVNIVFDETILCSGNINTPVCQDAQIALDKFISEYFKTMLSLANQQKT